LIVNEDTAEVPLYLSIIVLRSLQHSVDVPDFVGKPRSGTWTGAAPTGENSRVWSVAPKV